jgi:hypothetical protein
LGVFLFLHPSETGNYCCAIASSKHFFQNDMGLKSFDCARLSEKRDCAEFLILFETSLTISGELLMARSHQDALQSENTELKGYFK